MSEKTQILYFFEISKTSRLCDNVLTMKENKTVTKTSNKQYNRSVTKTTGIGTENKIKMAYKKNDKEIKFFTIIIMVTMNYANKTSSRDAFSPTSNDGLNLFIA